MTVGTYKLTLCDLSFQGFLADTQVGHVRNGILLISEMVEVQATRVIFHTVQAQPTFLRLLYDPLIAFPVAAVVLLLSLQCSLLATAVISPAHLPATFQTVALATVAGPCSLPKFFQGLGQPANSACLHADIVQSGKWDLNPRISCFQGRRGLQAPPFPVQSGWWDLNPRSLVPETSVHSKLDHTPSVGEAGVAPAIPWFRSTEVTINPSPRKRSRRELNSLFYLDRVAC